MVSDTFKGTSEHGDLNCIQFRMRSKLIYCKWKSVPLGGEVTARLSMLGAELTAEVTTKDNFILFDANKFNFTDLLTVRIAAMGARLILHGKAL